MSEELSASTILKEISHKQAVVINPLLFVKNIVSYCKPSKVWCLVTLILSIEYFCDKPLSKVMALCKDRRGG